MVGGEVAYWWLGRAYKFDGYLAKASGGHARLVWASLQQLLEVQFA